MTGDLATCERGAAQPEGLIQLKGAKDGGTPFVAGLAREPEQEVGRQDAGKVLGHTDKSNRSPGQVSGPSQGSSTKPAQNTKSE